MRIRFLFLCKFVQAYLADNRSFLTPCLDVANGAETHTGLRVNYCLCVPFVTGGVCSHPGWQWLDLPFCYYWAPLSSGGELCLFLGEFSKLQV